MRHRTTPTTKKTNARDLDQILDLYWGGSERRITGLTLRILTVNALALVILVVGVLYLGQSQKNLIETKLETFQAESELIANAIVAGAAEPAGGFAAAAPHLNRDIAAGMIHSISNSANKRIRLFDGDGALIADSYRPDGLDAPIRIVDLEPPNRMLYSIELLKKLTSFIISFSPDQRILPRYPDIDMTDASQSSDTRMAMNGRISLSAWTDSHDRVLLAAATPVMLDNQIVGTVLITRIARDIEDGIIDVWSDILRIFLGTLAITVLLSIYLSGAIARPLKRLARAAERIRNGHYSAEEIPDLSNRHDEIGELSLALKDMTRALWQRMDSIERFAADVSHELKNPLTSLKSALETVAIVKKEEDRQKLMNIIHHDVERLDRLITDISRASRLDTELSREAYAQINIPAILHHLLDIYQTPLNRDINAQADKKTITLADRNISISLNILDDPKTMNVLGIETRIAQVFQNLLSNALSFSKAGGQVKIQATRRLNTIVVTVEDEGPGIPESKMEAVFERFYSERPQEEDYGHHSGLGLSICRQIIDAHKGRIFAENRIGVSGAVAGAKFTVILNQL